MASASSRKSGPRKWPESSTHWKEHCRIVDEFDKAKAAVQESYKKLLAERPKEC